MAFECLLAQRLLHDGMAGHAPGPAAAPAHFGTARRHAQPPEGGFASLAAVPALPEAFAAEPLLSPRSQAKGRGS